MVINFPSLKESSKSNFRKLFMFIPEERIINISQTFDENVLSVEIHYLLSSK